MAQFADLQHLAVAIAIGFLIGFEREWRHAADKKERTFAGARTFSLVGFLGGLSGLLSEPAVLAAFLAVAALTIVSYWATARGEPGSGGTTEIALLATFFLGVTATRGEPLLAAAGGVAIAILLAIKPRTEKWALSMSAREIGAALRFLAISVIVLPVLPDQGYGPYDALNPRQIWLMVVLISGLSFLGYWLTKLYGARGVVITGLVGGLASSTATTLSLSRLVKSGATPPNAGAAGIIAANVMMIIRIGVLLFVVAPGVLLAIWPMLLAGGLAGAGAAILFWMRGKSESNAELDLGNPMEMKPALFFAALLAVIVVVSRFASERFGDSGLYAVALLTGLADVDALTLTAGNQAKQGATAMETAGLAVMLAAASNIAVKGTMTAAIAGSNAGVKVAAAFAAVIAAAGGVWLAVSAF